MPNTFFIADVHLSLHDNRRKELFLSFLRMIRDRGAHLYILGDLFDFWANNRYVVNGNRDVFMLLKQISDKGGTVGFLFGNRDFLLGKNTLQRYGVLFLGEETDITLGNSCVFLAHGHTLCTNDIQFLKYKQRMWPLFTFLDRILPGIVENYIAGRFIIKSKSVISKQDQKRLWFTDEAIESVLSRGIDTIICGHCHQYFCKDYPGGRFYALGDWTDTEGVYLVHENNQYHYRIWTEPDCRLQTPIG